MRDAAFRFQTVPPDLLIVFALYGGLTENMMTAWYVIEKYK